MFQPCCWGCTGRILLSETFVVATTTTNNRTATDDITPARDHESINYNQPSVYAPRTPFLSDQQHTHTKRQRERAREREREREREKLGSATIYSLDHAPTSSLSCQARKYPPQASLGVVDEVSGEMLNHTCRLCPCIHASRMMPANCRSLPTPAPSLIMNPAVDARCATSARDTGGRSQRRHQPAARQRHSSILGASVSACSSRQSNVRGTTYDYPVHDTYALVVPCVRRRARHAPFLCWIMVMTIVC